MVDNLSVSVRSRVMAATKGRGNLSTEFALARAFRSLGISGWRRHLLLPGRPDFIFRTERLAIFVDGCFWHGCPKHCRMPQTHTDYWRRKIGGNILRDKKANHRLKADGWVILRFWEHELNTDPVACAKKIHRSLQSILRTRSSKPGWSRASPQSRCNASRRH
jgi:DNA mismatch endonuclease (patch repair protein)